MEATRVRFDLFTEDGLEVPVRAFVQYSVELDKMEWSPGDCDNELILAFKLKREPI